MRDDVVMCENCSREFKNIEWSYCPYCSSELNGFSCLDPETGERPGTHNEEGDTL